MKVCRVANATDRFTVFESVNQAYLVQATSQGWQCSCQSDKEQAAPCCHIVGARTWAEQSAGAAKPSVQKKLSGIPAATVVRLQRKHGKVVQDCEVYIGRRVCRGGWDLPQSIWHNPYSIKACGSAAAAVERYRHHLLRSPHLLARLHELEGKVLGCWCKPGPCHGDVIVELLQKRLPAVSCTGKRGVRDGDDTMSARKVCKTSPE